MNGDLILADGRETLAEMHQLVEDGMYELIAGKPYEREYGNQDSELGSLMAQKKLLEDSLKTKKKVYQEIMDDLANHSQGKHQGKSKDERE